MRVADYIAKFLFEQGTRHIFMLSGGGSIYLDDGIACHKGLTPICVRHESTAPVMASAYSKLSNNIEVAVVTSGPGGINAISGLAEAWVDSSPVLVISGQVSRKYTSYNFKNLTNKKSLRSYGIQEFNIISLAKNITKYSIMVNIATTIKYHLEKAIHFALKDRKGPVWLDIPLDIQNEEINEDDLIGFDPMTEGVKAKTYSTELLKSLLEDAKKQLLIVIGQGIRNSNSISEIKQFAELYNIPIISSRLGQDILPYSQKNYFGHGGIKGNIISGMIMAKAKNILSFGSKLAVSFLGENYERLTIDMKYAMHPIMMIDIDEQETEKYRDDSYNANVNIKDALNYFITQPDLADYVNKKNEKWIEYCRLLKRKYPLIISKKKRNPIDLYYFVSRLNELSENHHIFVSDAGSSYYVTGQVLTFEKGQRELTSGTFASMGVAVSLAIGAASYDKRNQILMIVGDGSIELNIQELKTISEYNLNIKIFVINNGGYVSIRNTQDSLFEGRHIGSGKEGPGILDFSKVADTFGLPYFCIKDCEKIDDQILEQFKTETPALIEVVCDKDQQILTPIKDEPK